MGQALGIPDSGLLFRKEEFRPVDPNEPLDKLLLNKRFRHSFMEFADRYSIQYLTSYISRFHHLFKLIRYMLVAATLEKHCIFLKRCMNMVKSRKMIR